MPNFRRYFTPPGSVVPSSVSRDLDPSEYSFDTVVYQSGRPILDAELNLAQDMGDYNRVLMDGKSLPSGFLRNQGSSSAFSAYSFGVPPGVPVNSFVLSRLVATVAGMPVVVEYTNTTTPNANVITLAPATVQGGGPSIKRTDFVFLEVWRAQVAPSPRAYGWFEILTPQTILPGDTVTIDVTVLGGGAVVLTAVAGAPAVGQFQIGANSVLTAANLVTAIANPLNGLTPYVTANAHSSSIVQITSAVGGAIGNGVLLAESTAGARVVASGASLLGGADRPNKPAQDALFRHGNVVTPAGVNLLDNLVDAALNVESTQRVQVQYRLRTYANVLAGVNPKTQPDGFSNVAVLAQGATGAPVATYPFVPADGASVTANSSAVAYGFVDAGLWIAGDGTAAAALALGTVDGFAYALPVGFVFRRNDAGATGGFDPTANANGALSIVGGGVNSHIITPGPVVIPVGESDRPDGLFHDVLVAADILDLRRHVTATGYDFASELKYQTQSLLDQTNLTWQANASDMGLMGAGSGGTSTTPTVCDEIARPTDPLANVLGNRVRTFDHIARRFASQPVVERVVFEILPQAGPYPNGFTIVNGAVTGWLEGDTISLNFNLLEASSLQNWTLPTAATTVSGNWPVGTRVTDVLTAYHDDGHSAVPVDQRVQFSGVVGIGTPVVTVTLDYNPQVIDVAGSGTVLVDTGVGVAGSLRRIFLELEITYPTGAGLVRTPRGPVAPTVSTNYLPYSAGGPVIEYDPAQRPSEMAVTWVPQPRLRPPFREVLLEQKTQPVLDTLVTRNTLDVYTPRRIQTTVGLLANGAAPASATVGSSERKIVLAVAVAGQVPVPVSYEPQDAIPDSGAVGYRLDVYYQATAPQTAGVQPGLIPTNLLPHGLVVEPLSVSNHLWTGQTGAGSVELAFPYAVPMDQIPVPSLGVPLEREWYFSATAEIAVADFDALTGSLTLHSMVPMDGSNAMTLGDPANPTFTDAEFRAFYNFANAGGYKPTVMTQPLVGSVRHKVWTTMLARPRSPSLLFRDGELILLVFARFATLDPDNKVVVATPVLPALPSSVIAVYRTKNLLLSAGT